MRRVIIMLAALLLLLDVDVRAADDARQSVGLVLSGGGAKGIAHIGVIQALEDNDIPIDYITGTSMGTIVGGLYACGFTPQEMLDLILSRGFSYWSTGKIDPDLRYYFTDGDATPAMFSVPIGRQPAAADSVPASLISPLPMSFAFMELFSPYTAQCGSDFNRLFVPFHCVASDVAAKRKQVFRSGRLGDAIRASMSFPIVFQPTTIDGRLYYDGGIYDNFPVDVMREDFAPSIMIGVDVSTKAKGPQTTLMDQIENLVIQGGSYELPDEEGIKLRLDLNEFGLLDFPAARRIYKVGYDYAMSMMDSIKTRVKSRTPKATRELRRSVFKSQTPYLRFDEVNVYGASPKQNEYIEYLFRPASGEDTIGVTRARDAYYRALSAGKLRELYPQASYNDSTGLFDLSLKATPKGTLGGSLGGYITSATSSFLYLSAEYSSMSFRSLDSRLSAWIGQSVMAGVFEGKLYLHTPLSSAIGVQAVVSRDKYYESEHAFFDVKQPTFVINNEYFGRLMWSVAAGRRGRIDAGAGYGAVHSSYYRNNRLISYEEGKLNTHYKLGQAFVRYTSSTLDNHDYPTMGSSYNVSAMGFLGTAALQTGEPHGRVETHPKWVQLELRTRNYLSPSAHFSLGIESDVMLSTRKLLPTYSASMVAAPAFAPTPSCGNSFRAPFRANTFVAAGIVPVYKYNSGLSARLAAYGFVPLRKICESDAGNDLPRYGKWFSNPEFFGELNVSYQFPFKATLAGYLNYSTVPGDKWNVGISFGIYILPTKFMR